MLEEQSSFTIFKNENKNMNYNYHIFFFKYEGIIRKLLINYKFDEKSYLYKTFSNFMIKNEKFCSFFKNYDIIIPVPISKKRNKKRGYNQSYLIAKELSKILGIKLHNNILYKTVDITEQSKLGKEERKTNIQGVYSILNAEKLNNQKVILLDDIYTTGSTAIECCKMLRKSNVEEITVLTLAKD